MIGSPEKSERFTVPTIGLVHTIKGLHHANSSAATPRTAHPARHTWPPHHAAHGKRLRAASRAKTPRPGMLGARVQGVKGQGLTVLAQRNPPELSR